MSLKTKLTTVACSVSLVFLFACSPVAIPELEPEPERPAIVASAQFDNLVCNHNFAQQQLTSPPDIVENENNLIINGDTAGELIRSLINTVPNNGTGQTRWEMKWSFNTGVGANGCSVSDVAAEVQVDYQLPLWPDQLLASDRNLTEQWMKYSDELRAHHCRHGKTGIDAAIEVKKSLQAIAPSNNCRQLEVDADSLARNIVNRFKDQEAKFVSPSVSDYLRN